MTFLPPFFEAFGLSDVGKIRQENEDSFVCLENHGVFCVADGMGGMRDGAIASQTTINCIEQAFNALNSEPEAPPPSFKQKRDILIAALEDANRRMQVPASAGKDRRRSGSTAVALLLDPDNPSTAISVHAGDSRLYRLRNGLLTKLTNDHSAAAFLKGLSKHEKDSLLASELKSVVTRGIGLGKELNEEEKRIEVRKDDVYLLCSDGLSNMLTAERMRDMLTQCTDTGGISVGNTCQMLIAAANDAGGHDNITAIIVHITTDISDPVTATTEYSKETEIQTETTGKQPSDPESLMDECRYLFRNLKHAGRNRLLAIGIGFLIILTVGLILLGRPENEHATIPSPTIQEPPPPARTVQEPLDPELRIRLLDNLETEFRETLVSGHWNILQEKIDKAFLDGILQPEDRAEAAIRRIAGWYALWLDILTNEIDKGKHLSDLIDTQNDSLAKIGNASGVEKEVITWPDNAEAAASTFCSEVYRIRQAVIRKIIEARDENLREFNALIAEEADPPDTEKQIWRKYAQSRRDALNRKVACLLPIKDEPCLGPRKAEIPWIDLIDAFNDVQSLKALATQAVPDAGGQEQETPPVSTNPEMPATIAEDLEI